MAGNKILVGGSPTMQKVIRLALSSEGYEIQTVSNGNEAIQQISLFRPDLVLIDVALPGKNAFEVKEAVNAEQMFEGPKFVLMASAFEKVDEAHVKSAHFHGRLTRPFDPAQLRKLISDLLVGHASTYTGLDATPDVPGAQSYTEEEPTITSFTKRAAEPPSSLPPHIPAPPPPTKPIPKAPSFLGGPSNQGNFGTPPPPPPPPSEPSFLDEPAPAPLEPMPDFSDIKELTQSTVQMSGLDDYGWQVSETQRAPQAPAAPPSPFADTPPPGPSRLSESHLGALKGSEPAISPQRVALDDSDSNFFQSPPQNPFAQNPFQAQTPTVPLESHVERVVREEVERALEKWARDLIPEVAEKIVRQEIRKLLEEQP